MAVLTAAQLRARLGARMADLRQLATYLAARVVPALASMALTFLCIHTLSPADYGRYSLTLLPAGVVASLVGSLSAQAMLRYAHEMSPAGLRFGRLWFPLAASLAVGPLVLAYLAWSVGLSAAAFAAVGLVPLVALMDTRRSFFVARGRAGSVFALDVWRAAAALLIAWCLFAAAGARAEVPLLAQGLSMALVLLFVRPVIEVAAGSGRREVDRHYLRYGLWFAGWVAVIGVFALAERSVVERVAGLAASGRYAAQADVINAVFAATGAALASALMPRYLALASAPRGPAAARSMRRLLLLGLAGTAATAMLCVLMGAAVGAIGIGKISAALIADVPTALALVAAGAVWAAAGFFQKPLELSGQTRLTFAASAIALLLFLAIGPALGRALGPLGVALAKLAAGLGFVLLVVLATRRVSA